MKTKKKKSRKGKVRKPKKKLIYRSGLEEVIAEQMQGSIKGYSKETHYEVTKIPFIQPPKKRKTTVDWTFVKKDGTLTHWEGKGRLRTDDRTKILLVLEQHPDIDYRLIFGNANNLIRKTSPTTYADWCKKYKIEYCEKIIPESWFEELM